MTPHHPRLLEPSFADLIAAIEQAADLSEQTRRHWVCSLRQIAKWLDRPAGGDPRPLERDSDVSRPIASRSGRRHGQDLGEPQIQCPGGAALVRQGARRAAAGGAPVGRVGDVPRRLDKPYGTGSTTSCATARPAASTRRRSTTRSSMTIGATAPKRPHWHPTTRPGASWRGPGMPAQAAIDGWPLQRLTEPPIKVAEPAWEDFP